jgi:hypothetical protein
MATPPDLEFVATPPPAEDDLDELPAPPRRASRISAATVVLALASVGCIGFALGVVIEKKQLPKTNASTQVQAAAGGGAARSSTTVAGAAAGAAGAGGGGGAGGAGGGGFAGGGGLIGQVTAVDATTMTVTEANGNVVRVTIAPTSAITKTSSATATDIKAGDYVTVQGTAGADGTTAAARIVDSGATPPAAGRQGAGGAGGAGAAGGTGAAGGGGPGTTVAGSPTPTGPVGSRPARSTTVP